MIVLVWGVTGTGKTSVSQALAKKLQWQFLDADDFHPTTNIEKMQAGIPLTDSDRAPWLRSIKAHLDILVENDTSAVLACSALKQTYRQQLGVDETNIKSVLLSGDADLIAKRLSARENHFMNAELLTSQLATLEPDTHGLTCSVTKTVDEIVHDITATLSLE